jgi:ethanolamine ammonia-lyase small subunit
MDQLDPSPVMPDAWQQLRRITPARIALGHAGTSLPTQAHLDFQFAHACARDAVHQHLDIPPLVKELGQRGHEAMVLHSAAGDRHIYLQRPDQGRRLDDASRRMVAAHAASHQGEYDILFVIADGLSSIAVQENALPFLDTMLPSLARDLWRIAPIAIAEQARVAIGDEIGQTLGAGMVAILIGERPGLSAPDSMGIYLTYRPVVGTTDACRNCISNVRRAGLSHELAAHKLRYLMNEARRRRLTGVALKDEAEMPPRQISD